MCLAADDYCGMGSSFVRLDMVGVGGFMCNYCIAQDNHEYMAFLIERKLVSFLLH